MILFQVRKTNETLLNTYGMNNENAYIHVYIHLKKYSKLYFLWELWELKYKKHDSINAIKPRQHLLFRLV